MKSLNEAFSRETARLVSELLQIELPLFVDLPKWRELPEYMLEHIKATDQSGLSDVATGADIAAQRRIKNAVAKLHPGWAFWGEEEEDSKVTLRPDQSHLLIVDPIEGTNNFRFRKDDLWGSVTALIDTATLTPQIGIIGQPMSQRLYAAARGEGAWEICFNREAEITQISPMNTTPSRPGFTYNNSPHFEARYLEQVQRLLSISTVHDRPGADEIDAGRMTLTVKLPDAAPELFVDVESGALESTMFRGGIAFKTNVEMAAVSVLLSELGGRLTDGGGNPWSMDLRSMIFARTEADWDYLKRVYDFCVPTDRQNA